MQDKKRSPAQLRSYWLLIDKVTLWMNKQKEGNCFSSKEVDQYFKIISQHCTNINGVILAKSIANKSECSKEQMEALITEIIKFGAVNDIPDCFIRDDELTALLKFYE